MVPEFSNTRNLNVNNLKKIKERRKEADSADIATLLLERLWKKEQRDGGVQFYSPQKEEQKNRFQSQEWRGKGVKKGQPGEHSK